MNKKFIVIAAILIFIIVGIFIVKSKTGNAIKTNENAKEFTIKAFKFGYSPDTITVKKGDKVKITIENSDVLHGIRIPELNIKGNDVIEFTAGKSGEFTWYCANYCGDKHMEMKGKLIVK